MQFVYYAYFSYFMGPYKRAYKDPNVPSKVR